MSTMLSIDTGYAAIGWAYWGGDEQLLDAGVIKPGKTLTEVYDRMLSITIELEVIMRRRGYYVATVMAEEPTHFGGSGGNATAKTSLLGLAAAVGYLACWAYKCNAGFKPAPVLQWKGQLPKQTVNQRIRRILSRSEVAKLSSPASHDWDAVGIGLWAQGRFG